MRNHDIIFDREKMRVGFVQANCNYINTNRSTNDENNKMHDKEKSKTLEIIEIVKK